MKKLFKELALMFSNLATIKSLEVLTTWELETIELHKRLRKGESFIAAFGELVKVSGRLNKFFFGNRQLVIESLTTHLIFSMGDEHIILYFSARNYPILFENIPSKSTVLVTNFKNIDFGHADDAGMLRTPFTCYLIKEFVEEVSITGSVWDSAFPLHYGILTRSMAYSFPKELIKKSMFTSSIPLFNSPEQCEETAKELLGRFNTNKGRLISLNAYCNHLGRTFQGRIPGLLAEEKKGNFVLRKYSPRRSSIFDFGSPEEPFKRADWVTTYKRKDKEYHRDFVINPVDWGEFEIDLKELTFDLIHTIAIRRTSLFRHSFTSRLYNVLLPPALLRMHDTNGDYMVVYPCLLLNRTPLKGCFRNTVSLTFFVINARTEQTANGKSLHARKYPIEHFYKLKNDLLSQFYHSDQLQDEYGIEGPIKSYLELKDKGSLSEAMNDITEQLFLQLLNLPEQPSHKNREHLSNIIFSQTRIADMASLFLQVDWQVPVGYSQPWEKWVAGEDTTFKKLLFRTISYRDFKTPEFANTSYHAINLKNLNIGNTIGADMTGMTIYNPRENMKVILFPKSLEKYPNLSLIRWLTWHYYIDSALISLRVLIDKFHINLSAGTHLNFIISTLSNMVDEFVELYDLDLVNMFYRKEYEKIRNFLGIDNDYIQLISQFNSVKEDASLREQRLINRLVFALTLATVTVSIITTIATNEKWTSVWYVVITIVVSLFVIWLGYVFFDPVRLFVEKIISRLKKNGNY